MTTRDELERKYGLDPGDYEWLDLDGACWICQRTETVPNRRLAIDHDHVTGAVRGLLCTRCNQVLGRMRDDPLLLRAAATYIEKARDAFSDGCHECMNTGDPDVKWIYPPAGVLAHDGHSSQFTYVCDQGHRWTCWQGTRGVPFAWRM